MKFEIEKGVEILRQTPYVVGRLLEDLSDEWTASSGDPENWGPYDVIGHLLHGERTDWMQRAEIILSDSEDKRFVPFDRLAQFEEAKGRSLSDLLTDFAHLRNANIERLITWQLTEQQLEMTGIHPEFGAVTLRELLSTWVVHDLDHIRQIVTYMARQYTEAVGPWRAYLSIVR